MDHSLSTNDSNDSIANLIKLATLHLENHNYNQAYQLYKKIIEQDSLNQEALCNSAELLKKDKNYTKAIEFYKYILHHKLNNDFALNGLTNCYLSLEQPDIAFKYAYMHYTLLPDNPCVINSLALCYINLNQIEQGIALLQKALQITPNDPYLKFYTALSDMILKNFTSKNWEYYEARLDFPQRSKKKIFTHIPSWDSSQNLDNKTLLICCEQGCGDEMMFLHLIKLIKARYKNTKTIYFTYSNLERICNSCEFIDHTTSNQEEIEQRTDIDYVIFTPSLAHALDLKFNDIDSTPYLSPIDQPSKIILTT